MKIWSNQIKNKLINSIIITVELLIFLIVTFLIFLYIAYLKAEPF